VFLGGSRLIKIAHLDRPALRIHRKRDRTHGMMPGRGRNDGWSRGKFIERRPPESGVEYAYVDYGVGSSLEEIPRATYEERGYTPPFDQLPTKAMHEEWRRHNT